MATYLYKAMEESWYCEMAGPTSWHATDFSLFRALVLLIVIVPIFKHMVIYCQVSYDIRRKVGEV